MCHYRRQAKNYSKLFLMETKLVIFDLDGTLLNTVKDLGMATNYALKQCGYPERAEEEFNFLCGRGIINMFKGAMPPEEVNEENVQEMKDLFLPYYDAHKSDYTRPYPGIPELLLALKERGIRMGVASNKYQDGAEKLVAGFFPEISFVKILGQREGQPIKPDPAIVDQIMAQVEGISKENVVYCGDTNTDMQTGINAGVKTVGVTWGFRSREELEAYHPWLMADTPEQILENI